MVRGMNSETHDCASGTEMWHTFYSWMTLVAETDNKCVDIVTAILDARKDDAQKLAELCDASGRRVVDIATSQCKKLLLSYTQFCGRYAVFPNSPEHRSATSVVLRAEDYCQESQPDFSKSFDQFDSDKDGFLEPKELGKAAQSLGICVKLLQVCDSGKAVSRHEFVGACKKLIGDGSRQVVIKLIQDKTLWQRKKEIRQSLGIKLDTRFIV